MQISIPAKVKVWPYALVLPETQLTEEQALPAFSKCSSSSQKLSQEMMGLLKTEINSKRLTPRQVAILQVPDIPLSICRAIILPYSAMLRRNFVCEMSLSRTDCGHAGRQWTCMACTDINASLYQAPG